jgi:hypothetical protein
VTRALRTPTVAFSFAVEKLRRLPGARFVQNHPTLVIGTLVLAGALVLAAWAATRSPQRVSMADLTAGSLAPLQTWIIVSGDMRPVDNSAPGQFRYTLTDPNVPDATLAVTSRIELSAGQSTVSGTLLGGDAPQREGFAWTGQLLADTELAREPDPPWLAIGLFALAGLVGAAARTSYPTFFKETPAAAGVRWRSIRARVRREFHPDDDWVDATLMTQPGEPVVVHIPGEPPRTIRLHSAHSGADAGVLRTLSSSEPALVVRLSTGELLFLYATEEERDAVYAALIADVARPTEQRAMAG